MTLNPSSLEPAALLSKSEFLSFRECPKDLWLRLRKPTVVPRSPPSDYDRLLMEDGYAVEAIALDLLRTRPDAERFEFQVTISDGRCLIRVDALRRNSDGSIDLYEVKSSSSPEDHLVDACFQAIVAARAGLIVRSVRVVHVDADYRLDGELDPSRFLAFAEVDEELEAIRKEVEAEIDEALGLLAMGEIDERGCRCLLRTASRRCASFHHLNPEIPVPSAHLLPRISSPRLARLADEGRLAIADMLHDDVTPSQLDTFEALRTGQPVVRTEEVKAFLSSLRYPLHFYDYETAAGAVPMARGHGPHQQIPVQFSCHVLHADGSLEHREFLGDGHGMEEALVDRLKAAIGTTGSAIVWNQTFEKSCNRRMAELLPRHAGFLKDLNDRTADLMLPFRKGYVHPAFEGSASIKKILPVVCPDLEYDEDSVHNGRGAILAFREMVTSDETEERERLLKELRAYCHLDTLAMVRLHEFLLNLAAP